MKNVNIMGVHQFLGEGVTKNNIYEELPRKGGLAKNRKGVRGQGWYLDAYYDIILVHDGTWDRTCLCESIEFWSIFPAV